MIASLLASFWSQPITPLRLLLILAVAFVALVAELYLIVGYKAKQ